MMDLRLHKGRVNRGEALRNSDWKYLPYWLRLSTLIAVFALTLSLPLFLRGHSRPHRTREHVERTHGRAAHFSRELKKLRAALDLSVSQGRITPVQAEPLYRRMDGLSAELTVQFMRGGGRIRNMAHYHLRTEMAALHTAVTRATEEAVTPP
jgi:hypothetical protein